MRKEFKKNSPPAVNEFPAILSGAIEISKEYNFKEVCTEALLFSILNNFELTGCSQLETIGVDTLSLKRGLRESLKAKAAAIPARTLVASIALDGLLWLNGPNKTGASLLKTIIKNNNTIAARFLKAQRINLNAFNELTFTTPIN